MGEAATTLRGRFVLRERLGEGGQGITWRADDLERGGSVAVKRLHVANVPHWKAVELFEREGRTLASLNHPGIPRYVDAFAEDEGDGSESFYLVQEFVEGESLDAAIRRGARLSEEEARELTRQLGEILRYTHGLRPPVIHRDVKPSNIMRRPDGRYALIDFGAVQAALPDHTLVGGSTVVGTTGYMPPEQLLGRAVPQSDLYGLGATLVHLLGHQHPGDLPVHRLALDWRSAVWVSDDFGAILDGLLAPAAEDRFDGAQALLDALAGRAPRGGASPGGGGVEARPPGSRAAVAGFAVVVFFMGLAFAFMSTEASDPAPAPAPLGRDAVLEWTHPPVTPTALIASDGLDIAGLELIPRAETGGSAHRRNWLGYIANDGEGEVTELTLRWRLLHRDGEELLTRREDVVSRYGAPMRPGDRRPLALLSTTLAAAPARMELVVESLARAPAGDYPPARPVTPIWERPPPDGVALAFAARGERARGGYRRIELEVTNDGLRAITLLRIEARLRGPEDRSVRVARYVVAPVSTPSLLPGETETIELLVRFEGEPTGWELAVIDLKADG